MKIIENTNKRKFKLEEIIQKYYWIFIVIEVVFLAFICFWNLGEFPVRDWDESRHGVSAYEMMKNNENIINTYNYENDYWNLKPPLSFNLIIIAFKVLGTTILAFRIPSAIAMVLTGIIVAFFIGKRYGKVESLISLIAFSACSPLYRIHTGRHGDADALFILFFTISMISMLWIEKSKKALYMCGFSFALAFLTKSWHAFVIVAIGGLFLIFTGYIKKYRIKQWILFFLSFAAPIGLWIIARIVEDGTKFLVEMVRYDLLKRSSEAIEGNKGSIFYYARYILLNGTSLVIALGLIIVVGCLFYYKNWMMVKSDVIGYSLWIVVPFVLFSVAKTKLDWYIIPMYIPIIIVGSILFGKLLSETSVNRVIKIGLSIILAVGLSYEGYNLIKYINNPPKDELQTFMMNTLKNNENIRGRETYIQVEDSEGKGWRQSQLLVGELYGDLKCKEGGVEGFAANQDAMLITKKDMYLQNAEIFKNYEVVRENETYIIIKKQ
ncbi:ArnT family glycosyltransferase [Clostridium cibarium]|uniref:Glycosyltransferase family 39 protein n=1 Tax=Clostridium cibarium TaxID=2762247 RepID=A0ABR8PQ06_9CLOT|nr:glycosyltransferase family 39 protein [Clostridium cibarium]MBD7910249.1 glycosyltransferase family 39 protein [Clostridium cibarium]